MNTDSIKSLEIRKMNMLNSLVELQDKNKENEKSIHNEKNKIYYEENEIKREKSNLIKWSISTILISISVIALGSISLVSFTSSITELLLFSLTLLGIDSLIIYEQIEKYNKKEKNIKNEILESKIKITILNQKEEKYQVLIQDCQQLICMINKRIKETKKQHQYQLHQEKLLTTNIHLKKVNNH